MADRRVDAHFTELYRAHYHRLLRFVTRRTGDRAEAEDLTAEVFRIAWAKARDGTPITAPWLFVAAQNTLRNHHRSAVRRDEVNRLLATEMAVRGDTHSPALDVRDAVSRLSGTHRDILVLRYWDGLDGREIAGLLGISTAAVWVRLHRARHDFAEAFRIITRGDHAAHETTDH